MLRDGGKAALRRSRLEACKFCDQFAVLTQALWKSDTGLVMLQHVKLYHPGVVDGYDPQAVQRQAAAEQERKLLWLQRN